MEHPSASALPVVPSRQFSNAISRFALIAVLLTLTACGSLQVKDAEENPPPGTQTTTDLAPPAADSTNDPLEGFNRAIYSFNQKFDRYVFKPVAKGYRAVVPEFARKGISNFFSNLHDPVIMLNNLLQGKVVNAASDLGRFLVNSTVGIAGLFDVASHIGLDKHDEDFGQTLAVWGVGEGPYVVLPILGPSNLRDTVGIVPDWELYPVNYVDDPETRYGLILLEAVNRRSQLLDAGDILEQAAGEDPYVFVREAYRQRRQNMIYDGNPPVTAPDPSLFEDDPPAGEQDGSGQPNPPTGG